MKPRHVLILGGTGEARELAEQAVAGFGRRLRVVTSLAGRTVEPAPVAGEVRRGGFGGASGLAAHLREAKVDLLIDATHPFAVQISRHAAEAAQMAGVPRLVLVRPEWQSQEGDRWTMVDSAAAAAAALAPQQRRVWLTVGTGDLAAFTGRPGTWFLVRRVDAPPESLPLAACRVILGRGPFAVDGERRLIAEHAIDTLVCRASGGAAAGAKLVAAREARLPVIMIRRPAPPGGPAVGSPAAALAWLRGAIDS